MDDEIRVELERIRDEDRRQNRRLELLEESIKAIQELTISVHTLAHDMQQMLEEQRSQGKRLGQLEDEPAKSWKQAKTTLITAALSALAGSLVSGLMFTLSQVIH